MSSRISFWVVLSASVILVGCSNLSVVKESDVVIFQKVEAETQISDEGELSAPTEEEVQAMRSLVLQNMAEDDIEHLKNTVKNANLTMEHDYLYGSILENMKDPNSLAWNYIDKLGEIHVGWGYNTEDLAKKEDYNLSDDEFNQRYGKQVIAYNDVDGATFVEHMTEIKDTIYDEKLRKDFDALIWNMEQAMETHDVEYLYQIYRIFHDMDYYLLRYGISEMSEYVSDLSTVEKYYGVLEVYK